MQTIIDIPDSLATELDAYAAKENKSRDEVIKYLVTRFLLLKKHRDALQKKIEAIQDVAELDPELHDAIQRNSRELIRGVAW